MENKTMKTTEQINQIKTLKRLIAEMVAEHKATKLNEGRYGKFRDEREHLFIAYTAYYMLRHGIEDFDAYIESVMNKLKPEKQNKSYPYQFFGIELESLPRWNRWGSVKEAITHCVECLDKFIAKEQENAVEDGNE